MARPSLAAERRDQILDALERCLRRRGLEGTTLDAVAREAGVQRPLIRHYFGNRDELLAAAVARAVARHGREIEAALAERPARGRRGRLAALLDHLFLGGFGADPARDRIFRGLRAAAEAVIAAAVGGSGR